MFYYAVIDTNVLISSLLKNISVPGIDKMLSDIIQNAIFVNTDNVEELKEILPDPKDVVFLRA